MISLWTWLDSSSYGYCQYCLSQTLVQMFQIGKQADKFSRNCLQVGRSIIANSYFSLRLLLPICWRTLKIHTLITIQILYKSCMYTRFQPPFIPLTLKKNFHRAILDSIIQNIIWPCFNWFSFTHQRHEGKKKKKIKWRRKQFCIAQ